MNALVELTPKQLELIKRTVAKDCDVDSDGNKLGLGEFDLFIHTCQHTRLDPLRRQIYAFVFNKDDPKRRQLTIVTGIGGYRAIAERTGNYRPGPTRCEVSAELKDHDGNPAGIEYAEATVFKHSHGGWHEVTERAYWSEFAPVKEIPSGGWDWVDTGDVYPEGHKRAGKKIMRKVPVGSMLLKLDERKDNWRRMPRVMLEKCAEAKALRRAWPDDFAGLYVEDEMDRTSIIDITPTEAVEEAAAEAKLALIGGKDALTVAWEPGQKLDRVPAGQFCDRALAWAKSPERTSTEIEIWWRTNLPSRAEYKARHASEYLEFQKEWEAIKARVEKSEADQTANEETSQEATVVEAAE